MTSVRRTMLVFLTMTVGWAQADIKTGRYLNGRAWNTMSDDSRVSYAIGFNDALMAARIMTMAEEPKCTPIIERQIPEGFNLTELADAVTLFYNDPTNVRIPIHNAFRLTFKKMQGIPSEEYERIVAAMRRATR